MKTLNGGKYVGKLTNLSKKKLKSSFLENDKLMYMITIFFILKII